MPDLPLPRALGQAEILGPLANQITRKSHGMGLGAFSGARWGPGAKPLVGVGGAKAPDTVGFY